MHLIHWYILIIFLGTSVDIMMVIPLFSNWSRCTMFFTSQAAMRFHFVLNLLRHISLNHLTISSSHRRGGLPSGNFRFLGYQLTTAQIHLLSANLATSLAQRNFCISTLWSCPSRRSACEVPHATIFLAWIFP